MDPLSLGALIAFFTVIVLFSGVPVGAGLLIVATGFLFVFDGPRSLQALPELFYAELNSFALLSIPMFIIWGQLFRQPVRGLTCMKRLSVG